MSQFDSSAQLNDLVKRTRATTPPGVTEQRAVRRMSIDEMNATDIDTLREKFQQSRQDDRGPVERFLDTLDAPRNLILSTLAPGLERRARERGETGAFGQGKVMFSDVLGEMGLKPGIVRGVLGFVGDVATDPLTWVGPVGLGAKVGSAGGRGVRFGVQAGRELKTAEKAIKAGVPIKNQVIAELADVAGKPEALRAAVFGDLQAGRGVVGKAKDKFKRILGADDEFSGGLVAKYAERAPLATDPPEVQRTINAVQNLIQNYGIGAGPGIRIGKTAKGNVAVELAGRGPGKVRGATTGLLHVPFTDVGLHVPALTGGALAAASGLEMARLATQGPVDPATSKRIEAMRAAIADVDNTLVAHAGHIDDERAFHEANKDALDRLKDIPQRDYSLLRNAGADPDELILTQKTALEARRKTLAEELNAKVDAVANLSKTLETESVSNPLAVLALKPILQEYRAKAALAAAKLDDLEPTLKLRSSLMAQEAERLDNTLDVVRRLASHDTAGVGMPYTHRSFLGLDINQPGVSTINPDLNVVGEVSTRVRPLLDDYDKAVDELVKAQAIGDASREQRVAGKSVDELRAEVNTLRDRIVEETAPLRMGANRSIDDTQEAIRELDRSRLAEANRDLVNIPDHEAELRQAQADALHKQFQASIMAAMATRGSAIEFLSKDQRSLLRLQKQFLGTEDDIVGVAGMAPLRVAARMALGNKDEVALEFIRRADAAMSKRFGGDAGWFGNALRHAAYMSTDGGRRKVSEAIYAMRKDLHDILAPRELTNKVEEVGSLLTAMAYKNRGGGLFHARDITGKPTKLMQSLEDAVRAGMLDEKINPGLKAELEAFAAKWSERLLDTTITAAEREAGILPQSKLRQWYLPNELTGQGRSLIDTARKSGTRAEGSAGIRGKALEGFEKPRTSDSAVFQSAITGKQEEVFNADRWAQGYSDAEIAAISDPAVRAEAERLRGLLDEYDSLPDRPPMLANDPMRINELIEGGRFNTLFGTDGAPGGIFDTNFLTMLASRLGQHEHAMGRETAKEVIAAATLPITASTLEKMVNNPGAMIDIGGGTMAKVIKLSGGQNGVRVGDDVFRALKPEVRNAVSNPLIDMLGKDGIGALYHENVARVIEDHVRVADSHEFWKWLDSFTSTWKTMNLFHPSWTIGNLIGDSMNMAAQDLHYIPSARKYGKQAIQAVRLARDPEALSKIKLVVDGQETTMAQIMEQIKDSPVLGANLWTEPNIAATRGNLVMPSRMGEFKESFGKEAIKTDWERAAEYARIGEGRGDIASKAEAAYRVANDRMKRWLLEPWYVTNEKVQDAVRLIGYLSLRDQGFDHASATSRLIRAAFDYHNMTNFERTTMRRIAPFYSWIKNNAVYQAKMLLERPIYAGAVPHVKQAIEEALDGEGQLPTYARPKWMREQLAIQFGTSPDARTALTIGSWLPQEQAYWAGRLTDGWEGIQNGLTTLAGNLNPAIRVPLEAAAGKEFGTDRTIGPSEDQADISMVGAVANQIRPLREAKKIAGALGEQGVLPAVGRVFAGGRIQPMTDDRIRVAKAREFQAEEDRLRKNIRTAEFKKDTARSVAGRAMLLRLYEDMVRQGYADQVPKWAQARLSEFAQ